MKKHLIHFVYVFVAGIVAPLAFSGCEVDVDPADEGPIEDAIEDAADD